VQCRSGFRTDREQGNSIVDFQLGIERDRNRVQLLPVHKKQILTYLRLADKRLGLLINFNVALIKDGISRVVNGLEENPHAEPPSRKDAST
jgi:hypothetical protein